MEKLSKKKLFAKTIPFLMAGVVGVTSYKVGVKKGYEEGVSVQQEQILDSIGELKEELTSDLISLMKARTQLSSTNKEKHEYHPENIYVLDTYGEGIQIFGEAKSYAYRYIFFESKEIPNNFDEYHVMFVEEYNTLSLDRSLISACKTWGTTGDYIIPKSENGYMNYVEPLSYYLTKEEFESIKDGCSYAQLESLFYSINLNEKTNGWVLERNVE